MSRVQATIFSRYAPEMTVYSFPDTEQRSWRRLPMRHDSVLNLGLVISTAILLWSSFSTRIDHVDPGILSMLALMPRTYWIGIVALACTTLLWSLWDAKTKRHVFIVLLWIGYFFIGPELMETHPRSPTTYDHAWGVLLFRTGLLDHFVYPYHGLQYLFATAAEVMGSNYLTSIRFGVLTMYAALFTVLAMFFATLRNQRRFVLGMLVAVAMFSVTGITLNPATLALAVGLTCLYPIYNPRQHRKITIPIVAYSVLPAVHGLTSLVVVYIVSLLALTRLLEKERLAWRTVELRLLLLMTTTLLAWHMYRGQIFGFIVTSLRESFLRGSHFAYSALYHVSPFRDQRSVVAGMTLLFIVVLGIWVISVLLGSFSWNSITVSRIFPLVIVAGLPLLIVSSGNFSYEGLVRAYFYAVPWVSLFLAAEARSRRVTLLFLPVLLSLGLVLLYSREFEELPPKTQVVGATFVQRISSERHTLLSAECLSVGSVIGVPNPPVQRCIAIVSNLPREIPDPRQFSYVVVSEFGRKATLFLMGEQKWKDFADPVRLIFSRLYSNGPYEVYTPALK